jgi:hypothetical protein
MSTDFVVCPEPFSLIPDSICERVSQQMIGDHDDVVDMLPCTTFQTMSLIQGQKKHKTHYAWFLIQIKGVEREGVQACTLRNSI